MNILVVDGQGGKLGAQIITSIKEKNFSNINIIAVGTNSLATQTMLKAKADIVATGENPIIVNSRNVDIIVGPVGIVIADSLYGEVTPNMALAISQSQAKKILIPINKCDNIIVGVNEQSMTQIFSQITQLIEKELNN